MIEVEEMEEMDMKKLKEKERKLREELREVKRIQKAEKLKKKYEKLLKTLAEAQERSIASRVEVLANRDQESDIYKELERNKINIEGKSENWKLWAIYWLGFMLSKKWIAHRIQELVEEGKDLHEILETIFN